MSQADEIAKKLHPLSLLFELANRVRTNLIPAIFASFSVLSGGIIGLYIGCGVFGIAITYSVIRFLTFRYRLTESELLVDQGLVFHNRKAIPLERIQNIDSVQNIFHRILGVAEVRIETASGTEPEATMRVLGIAELDSLKSKIRDLSARTNRLFPTVIADSSDAVSQVSNIDQLGKETTLLSISTRLLMLGGFLSNRGQVFVGLAIGYFIQGQFSGYYPWWPKGSSNKTTTKDEVSDAIRTITLDAGGTYHSVKTYLNDLGTVGLAILGVLLVLLVLFMLRLFSVAWFVWRFSGYRLTIHEGNLYVRCGLITKISATVPQDRIQLISIQRNWLYRAFGLVSIRLETSGGSEGEGDDAAKTVGRKWFIPVMLENDLPPILRSLHPKLDWNPQLLPWQSLSKQAFRRTSRIPLGIGFASLMIGGLVAFLSTRMIGGGIVGGGLAVAAFLTWIEWKQSKSRKYARDSLCVIYRSGILVQRTSIGFLDRIQCVDLVQSPFDRRWKMASLHFDTAGAGAADHELTIELLDQDSAQREFDELKTQVC